MISSIRTRKFLENFVNLLSNSYYLQCFRILIASTKNNVNLFIKKYYRQRMKVTCLNELDSLKCSAKKI